MRRFHAESPEVVWRGDKSFTEEVMPNPIDDDAACEGVVRRDEVVSEFKSTTELSCIG